MAWHALKPKLDGRIVIAHNASFDISVLRRTLDLYGLEYPTLSFGCTLQLSKVAWPGIPDYKLDTVTQEVGITFNQHHDALHDAEACARLALKILERFGVGSLEDLQGACSYHLGHLQPGNYVRAGMHRPQGN